MWCSIVAYELMRARDIFGVVNFIQKWQISRSADLSAIRNFSRITYSAEEANTSSDVFLHRMFRERATDVPWTSAEVGCTCAYGRQDLYYIGRDPVPASVTRARARVKCVSPFTKKRPRTQNLSSSVRHIDFLAICDIFHDRRNRQRCQRVYK